MKEELIKFLKKSLKYDLDYDVLLEKPKNQVQGDFAFPCFLLSKELKQSPQKIAEDIKNQLKLPKFLEKIEVAGPYVNFFFNSKQEAQNTIKSIFDKSLFIFDKTENKILIEYPSPNTNKALHLGHVRNMLIGNSLCKIFEKTGNEVIRINLNNDRGIAICKSMLGYELFFKNETPKSLNLKSDEFVSKCYVKFEEEAQKDDSLNKMAQDMLVKWEAKDKNTLDLWNKILNLVFEGYHKTYQNYKLKEFDKEYFESEIYSQGKEIVLKALENNISGFGKEEDGAVFCDLTDSGYDKKYLLRGDGTTLYMTQDIYLASLKENEFKAEKYIFIVGKEQEYHFRVLFEILNRLKLVETKNNYHFAYGYVYDKDGQKFSSRKGRTIGADWLLDEIVTKAKENLVEKDADKKLDANEANARAKIIGYSALSFSILKVNPVDDIKFDLEKSLAFEGETGPYLQYTYARIKSILRKAEYDQNNNDNLNINYSIFDDREKAIIKILKEYKEIVAEASNKYKISLISNYLIRLAKTFNEFYQNSQIINSPEDIKKARLLLISSIADLLKDGLNLLDIEVLEEM